MQIPKKKNNKTHTQKKKETNKAYIDELVRKKINDNNYGQHNNWTSQCCS